MIWVTQAEYLSGYRIRVAFNDGSTGVVDLEETIVNDTRPIFRAVQPLDAFRRFHVEMDTIVWDNGLDLAPEYLHRLAVEQDTSAA